MSVKKYLDARKKAEKKLTTLEFEINDAYYTGMAMLRGEDGLIDTSLLEDDSKKDIFKSRIVSELLDNAQESFYGSNKELFNSLGKDKKDDILFAYLGVAETQINNIIDEGNITREKFVGELQEKMQDRFQRIHQQPSSELSLTDAQEVVEYTKMTELINPQKLGFRDMIGLLDVYDRFDIVPPKFLEKKPYKI
jgi:hypothetical protein